MADNIVTQYHAGTFLQRYMVIQLDQQQDAAAKFRAVLMELELLVEQRLVEGRTLLGQFGLAFTRLLVFFEREQDGVFELLLVEILLT